MPDPFNRTKMSGDTHPPELDADLPLEEGAEASSMPTDRGTAAERGDHAQAGSKAGPTNKQPLDNKRRRDSER